MTVVDSVVGIEGVIGGEAAAVVVGEEVEVR